MKWLAAYVTNTGTVRKNNQDSLLVQEILLNEVSQDAPVEMTHEGLSAWFIVADGMGGESAGEEASGEALRFLTVKLPELKTAEDLPDLLEGARAELDKIAARRKIRLGTTMAGLVCNPQGGFAFNVGDCRVYKISGGYLNRITRDHSLAEEAAAAGLADSDKVPKNIVTSAILGGEDSPMQIYSRPVTPKPGDRFLICSDGLWGALPVEDMEKAFALPTPIETARSLLPQALEKSQDNVTYIILQVLA